MKHLRPFLAAAILALLTACAQPPTKPASAEDVVQYARAQVGAIYQTIGDLKATGQITQTQAKAAIAKTEPLEKQVEDANALLVKGQGDQAQAIARGTLLLLTELRATLPAPKGKS